MILLLRGECLIIVWSTISFIAPELSDKWSVRSLLSMFLPALFIDFTEHFISYPTLDIFIQDSLFEKLYKYLSHLLPVIDSHLFEEINYPLEIRRPDIDAELLELRDLLLSDFVDFLIEGPILLRNRLGKIVDLLFVMNIKVRYDFVRVNLVDPAVLQKLLRFLYWDICEQVWDVRDLTEVIDSTPSPWSISRLFRYLSCVIIIF